MAFAGHGFAVEVGVGDGFSDNATVVGGVAEADDGSHTVSTITISLYFMKLFRNGIYPYDILIASLVKKPTFIKYEAIFEIAC
ncbi:hypothetical protein D3C84_1134070 [compost metagenome]